MKLLVIIIGKRKSDITWTLRRYFLRGSLYNTQYGSKDSNSDDYETRPTQIEFVHISGGLVNQIVT